MVTSPTLEHKPLPPGDMGLPWLGVPPRLLSNSYVQHQYAKYGPLFKTRVIGRNIAVFVGPEANRFVLQSGAHHFSWRGGWPATFKAMLGESLFVQDGEEHRQKRRLITPAFHREALHNYLHTMEALTLQYLEKWAALKTFQWVPQYKQFTFEIASTLLMGSAPGAETAFLSEQFHRLTNGFLTVPLNWAWTPYGRALRARRELLRFIDAAVEKRRQQPTQDALGLLVQTRDEQGNALTNEELQAQTLLLLFAGHETSASMLSSAMRLLAEHPAVREQAIAEQEALNLGEQLTMEDLRQMPYLEQILKETERLYPPVPAGFRSVVEPFEFNGYYVPEGWTAIYLINGAHRDPEIYTDPDRFDPDRFSPERNESNVPFSLVGFGGGARVCVGFAFAQLEMKVLLSHLLRKYSWELVPGQNLNTYYFPTLAIRSGLEVNFQPR